LRWWKTARFVKDEAEYAKCTEIVRKYFPILKATHIAMTCHSVYPATSMNDYAIYCKKANLYDANLPSSTVDRLFISANFEVDA